MRTASIVLLSVLGLAVIAAAGFLAYLNWAFAPKRSSSASTEIHRIKAEGPCGERLFYTILERVAPSVTIHEVYLSFKPNARAGGYDHQIVAATNGPIPIAVRRVEPGVVEVEFDRGVPPSDGTRLRVELDAKTLQPVRLFPLRFENGSLVTD